MTRLVLFESFVTNLLLFEHRGTNTNTEKNGSFVWAGP